MNEATKKTLSQFKELTDNEKHDARQKFVRMKDATEMYHMSRPKMTEEALKAGALYKLGATVIFRKYYMFGRGEMYAAQSTILTKTGI